MREILASGSSALLFAAVFLNGGRVRPLRLLIRDEHSIVSFGGGAAAAYVFVHVMPELHEARLAFTASTSLHLWYKGMAIYCLALAGFLVFYGLAHLSRRLRATGSAESAGQFFRLHVGGFAAYVFLMAYQLVHNLKDTPTSMVLYTVAVFLHFFGVDYALRGEHGTRYDNTGRFVLTAMCLAGWAMGLLIDLPRELLALSVAFVSGAIIMNSLITELPSQNDARFFPFLAGGVLYGFILLPLS